MNFKVIPFLHKWESVFVFFFLLIISFAFYGDFLYMNPRFNHLWAQTDRMCLALGFVENGLNFFKPQVCNLGSSDGTVGVEFPLLFYIAAVFMKIFNSDSPFFVRFFSLTMSLVGLIAIFKIFRLIKVNFFFSLFGIIILYFSPIFFFYQANFNPNHFGFGLASLAIYNVVKYNYNRLYKNLLLFYFFGTLSTLIKASYGLYFLSGTFYIYYLNGLDYERIFKQSLLFIAGLSLNIAYFLYNLHLNKVHGSYFFTINVESYDDFFQFLWDSGHVISFWFKDIIFFWHWIFLVSLILFVGTFSDIFITRKKFIFSSLIFFGSISVYYLMGKQYMIHDYYIIDVFYLPLSLFLVCIFYKTESIIRNQVLISVLSVILIVISSFSGVEFFKARTTLRMDNRGDWITRDFEGSYKILDSLGISRKERLVIFDPFCPDGILFFLKRKGVGINFLNPTELKAWREKGFKYLIIQNLSISEYPDRFAEGQTVLDEVYTDGKFKVFKIRF